MLDSPDLKGRRTDTSSDDIWQQEKVGILCNRSLVMMTMGIFRSRRRWWSKCLPQL